MQIIKLSDGTTFHWAGSGTYYSTDGTNFHLLKNRIRIKHYTTKLSFAPRTSLTFNTLRINLTIPSGSNPN